MKTANKLQLKNDGTLSFYMVKHIKGKALGESLEDFCCWFVKNMIFPYCHDSIFLKSFYRSIGFKKEPTMDKIYFRLKELELVQ